MLVWCYCDGMVGRLNWGLAALEALLRLRLALAWFDFLFLWMVVRMRGFPARPIAACAWGGGWMAACCWG